TPLHEWDDGNKLLGISFDGLSGMIAGTGVMGPRVRGDDRWFRRTFPRTCHAPAKAGHPVIRVAHCAHQHRLRRTGSPAFAGDDETRGLSFQTADIISRRKP